MATSDNLRLCVTRLQATSSGDLERARAATSPMPALRKAAYCDGFVLHGILPATEAHLQAASPASHANLTRLLNHLLAHAVRPVEAGALGKIPSPMFGRALLMTFQALEAAHDS